MYALGLSLVAALRSFHTVDMTTDATNSPAHQTRSVLITGGTSGIGFAAASSVLQSAGPWHVIVANRDVTRAETAVDVLRKTATAGNTVESLSVDLASLASVRTFATDLVARVNEGTVPPFQAVVCNAGVQAGASMTRTTDGFESSFGVNHLAHFLLVEQLRPVLTAPARVVVVASDTHDPAMKAGVPVPAWSTAREIANGTLGASANTDGPFVAGQRRYSTSKLANIFYTYELARRLPDGVTANAFNPGLVPGTGLQRSAPAPVRIIAKHVLPRMTWLVRRVMTPNVHTAEESGSALAYLAIDPALDDTTGAYFDGRTPISSSEESYDQAKAKDLWSVSETLVRQ